jgi:hypothetical protein
LFDSTHDKTFMTNDATENRNTETITPRETRERRERERKRTNRR